MLKAAWLQCVLLTVLAGPVFSNVTGEAWIALVPELASLRPGLNQAGVNALLRRAGMQIDAMLDDFVDVSMAEESLELRFDANDMIWNSRRASLDYSIDLSFREGRRGDAAGGDARPGYMEILSYFTTDNQNRFQFSPYGHVTANDHEYELIAFVSNSGETGLEGVVWFDARQGAIRRILVELPGTPATTMDVVYNPVHFGQEQKAVWLPGSAAVSMHRIKLDSLSVYRFSNYEHSGESKGSVVDGQERLPNAVELLGQASETADEPTKEALLQRAATLDSERPETHFQIAIGLWKKKALTEAEGQLRTALKAAPDAFAIHNLLAIVLFERNDVMGAISEFRASLTLNSTNATAHFNLAEALQKSGDVESALKEYRKAAELEPDSRHFSERMEARSHQAVPESADPPIRVDVRQVVVPVVVTRDGHHVSGLSRNDFHLFEDGVEQKIAVFRVEKGGPAQPIPDSPGASLGTPPWAQGASNLSGRVNRTYVVCVDSLHTAFNNLVSIRKALVKLFGEEREGDSQYAVITAGSQMTSVRDLTRSPAAALAAVEGKEFERAFLASRRGSTEIQTADFRREAGRVRSACDHAAGDPASRAICDAGKLHLQSQADQLAEFERLGTVEFLRQLRFLVEKMATVGGGRSLVLVSDGFNMVPGQVGYLLLEALFPEMRGNSLRGEERIAGELEPILRMAQQKNVVLYTIDSRGLSTLPLYNAEESGGSARVLEAMGSVLNSAAQSAGNTLQQIASDTGGTSFRNRNDLLTGLEQAFADGRDYYTLAYSPANTSAGKQFHKIAIKTNDSKVRINAKSGYWTE